MAELRGGDAMTSLFSFKGRAARQQFWLVNVALFALGAVLLWGSLTLFDDMLSPQALLLIPIVWVGLALTVRRLHDRNKAWWWVLIFVILPEALTTPLDSVDPSASPSVAAIVLALVGAGLSLWALVELGFLPGTKGDNRFGPDPKA